MTSQGAADRGREGESGPVETEWPDGVVIGRRVDGGVATVRVDQIAAVEYLPRVDGVRVVLVSGVCIELDARSVSCERVARAMVAYVQPPRLTDPVP